MEIDYNPSRPGIHPQFIITTVLEAVCAPASTARCALCSGQLLQVLIELLGDACIVAAPHGCCCLPVSQSCTIPTRDWCSHWRCLQAADRNGKLNAAGQHSSAWSFSKAKPHTPQQGISGLQYLYADQMRENLGMFSPGPMYSPEPQPSASPVRTRPANHSMGPRGTTHMQHLRKLDMSPGPVYSGSKQDRRGWHLWGHEVCCQYIAHTSVLLHWCSVRSRVLRYACSNGLLICSNLHRPPSSMCECAGICCLWHGGQVPRSGAQPGVGSLPVRRACPSKHGNSFARPHL